MCRDLAHRIRVPPTGIGCHVTVLHPCPVGHVHLPRHPGRVSVLGCTTVSPRENVHSGLPLAVTWVLPSARLVTPSLPAPAGTVARPARSVSDPPRQSAIRRQGVSLCSASPRFPDRTRMSLMSSRVSKCAEGATRARRALARPYAQRRQPSTSTPPPALISRVNASAARGPGPTARRCCSVAQPATGSRLLIGHPVVASTASWTGAGVPDRRGLGGDAPGASRDCSSVVSPDQSAPLPQR